jgi:hypothetical protein
MPPLNILEGWEQRLCPTSKTIGCSAGPIVYTTEGPWADIAPCIEGTHVPASEGLKPGIGIIWGLLRGSSELIDASLKAKQPWVYLDHGYFHRGHYDGHYRMTLCDFQQRTIIERPADRWERLGVRLKPWRKGKEIIVCPPSDHVCRVFGLDAWERETVRALKEHTDRPIRVRRKTDSRTFLSAISDAHCVVTHNSLAAVEAAVFGVPVFVDKSSAAAPVALTDLTKIETPIYPDREGWACSLAYGQFTRDEMKSGLAWESVNGGTS